MGYLVVQSKVKGQVVLDGSRILSVVKGGSLIDFVLGPQESNPNKNDIIRFTFDNQVTEATLEQFNAALIQCEVEAFVNVLPFKDQEVKSVFFNPTTPVSGTEVRDSFSGTFVNFGVSGGSADTLGGDTVCWGTELTTAADHLGSLMIMDDCKVDKIGVKWSSNVGLDTVIGGATVSFKFSKCTNINGDVTDPANWTTAGTVNTQWRSNSGSYPGFLEVKTNDNITYSAGDLLAFTASSSAGFSNTGEDVEVTMILAGTA
jgi:hypothetical protein|tara:strand:+ start:2950 stop:3729 length:780 start_codon:yes stop_codon:yes gene_type:complete